MKTVFHFLLLFLFPLYSQAQNCSANPGGDQTICFGDPMVLYGEDSDLYLHPLEIEWTVVVAASPVIIADPNSLQTNILPNPIGGVIGNGEYIFELTVTCIDNNRTSSMVTIIVGGIENPAMIENPVAEGTPICERQITLRGSVPDPGVSTLWLVKPGVDVFLLPNGNDVTVFASAEDVCDYTLYYYQNIGSCESVDSTTIHFTKSYNSMSLRPVDPVSCPSCSRRVLMCGTIPGCDGTPSWSVSPSAGVVIESPTSNCSWIEMPGDGEYEISYTIDNGVCPTDVATYVCEIKEQDGFDIGFGNLYLSCSDTWDLPSVDLAVNDMAGVVYSWTAESNIGSNWISFTNPTESSTTVEFAGTPFNISDDGLEITITVTASYNGCTDQAVFRFIYNPTITVEAKDVYLLCGGDANFNFEEYYRVSASNTFVNAEVITAPAASGLPSGSFPVGDAVRLDLRTPGQYSFLLTSTTGGFSFDNGASLVCMDTATINILVADIPTINAGSDIVTCLNQTQLNGNTPLDINGDVVDIPVLWELLSGQTGVQINADSDQDPLITGLMPGEEYIFRYSFSQTEDCDLSDEMMVSILPEEECVSCKLSLELNGTCEGGCVTLVASGAESYTWSTEQGVILGTGNELLLCNFAGGVVNLNGFVGGELCGLESIELEPCTNVCELGEGTAEAVYLGCIPHQGNSHFFDIILPDFPVVDLATITVVPDGGGGNYSNVLIYYDSQNRLHYSGIKSTGSNQLCFTIYLNEDEECNQYHCIELPNCPQNSCNCIYYIPTGQCYAEGNQFALGVNVIYQSSVDGVASEILAYNVENPGEASSGFFSAPDGSNNQYSGLEFYGTDINNDGVVRIHIQILGAEGQILCEDEKQFAPAYICDAPDLLTYILAGGEAPGGSFAEGDRSRRNPDFSKSKALSSFPVPVSDYLYIRNPENLELKIELFDVSGKLRLSSDFSDQSLLYLSCVGLQDGVYLMRLRDRKEGIRWSQLLPIVH